MRQIFAFLLIVILQTSIAQQTQDIEPQYQLRALTVSEEVQLKSLPVLRMNDASRSRELPDMVDNSTEIYMRPAFNQAGLSCGQASGVAYNFTYEMARARNVAANTLNNQYTTHFTWNWWNGGNGWYGVSYLHSFQVLKYVGEPDAMTYGGSLSYGGNQRWMSGYPAYLTAMSNRITEAYQIPCGTAEELITLKHWLNDHLDGSTVGGLASYYAQYLSVSNQLPPGTAEAGKYVITAYGGSPNHAMTIVGYNDSIRWDYNNDGYYTNDIDINGDGEVNMKDWEIGGFKMVQSYGGVPAWGDQGFAYMMYKTVADDLGQGGIWNHCVHVLDVKAAYDPKLTAQVTLTHDRRDQIKVLVGLSNHQNASSPDIIMDFPILDYQGAGKYMQGGDSEAEKTIEVGLDLSSLLSKVDLNHNVKIFLLVVENDPNGYGTGSIDSFSIWDLTNTPVNTACEQTNVPLIPNDTTILDITYNFNFDRVNILDTNLPPAPEGEQFSHQMTASGGTTPYTWELNKSYARNQSIYTYPSVTGQRLYPSNNGSGKVTQALDFDFPFYDSSYSSICVHVDGYLMFDEQLYPYPYFNDDKVLFEVTRNISPFNTQYQQINSGNGDGIWYEGDSTYATVWFKTTHVDDASTSFNYAVTIYPDGKISYFYGNMTGLQYLEWWTAGISDGNTKTFDELEISHSHILDPNKRFDLIRYNYPPEFEISEDGLLTGIPQVAYSGTEISFKVTDNNFIYGTKTLLLSSSGIIVQQSVESGDDDEIEYGETADISLVVTSVEDETIENVSMAITSQDGYITITDSTEIIGTLLPGIPVSVPDAFSFDVSSEIPNNHPITLQTDVITPDTNYPGSITYTAYAPVAGIATVLVDDDNHRLDPGDTANIIVNLQNTGGAPLNYITALLSTEDDVVNIISGEDEILSLEPGETQDVIFTINVNEDTENGHVVDFEVEINGDFYYSTTDLFSLVVGFNSEDFETGDLYFIGWGFEGDQNWQVDPNTHFEGAFSARSGYISHMQQSVMMLDMEITSPGDISFYKKVSCEADENNHNYDYLSFLIDGVEQQRWDGDQGYHRFKWMYSKDTTVSRLLDAAWVDYITFPPGTDAAPVCLSDPDSFELTLKPDFIHSDTLWLTNSGDGELDADLFVTEESSVNSADRSLFGSYLFGSQEYVRSNNEYTISLTIYNASDDNEWIRDLYIDFPEGVELSSAGEFVGGSGGNLIHDGTFGDGITAHWHGEDSVGWGVIKGGQTAFAEIQLYVHEEVSEDISLNFEIHGENYAEEPHIIYGAIPIRNLGPEIDWLSIDAEHIQLTGGATQAIPINYNTAGLLDGNYNCEILILDNFQQESIIPVYLTVDHQVGSNDHLEATPAIRIFPNPASNSTTISYSLSSTANVNVDILNIQGKKVKTLINNQSSTTGKHLVKWNLSNHAGNQLPPGIYFCKLSRGNQSEIIKLVITK